MIWIFTIWAGIATVATGSELFDADHPTGAQIAVFAVAAAFALVGMVLCALTGDDE